MSSDLKPFSIHSFMLPMRWDYLPVGYTLEKGKEQFSFEERTDLSMFLECLLAQNTHWKRKFFRINGDALNFNEFHYFHAYASRTMFDLEQQSETAETIIDNNKVMVYFEYDIDPVIDKYIIKTDNKIYELNLTGISLHVYNSGVVILTINAENHVYDSVEDVLKINEYGRRIYPQFLSSEPPHTHKAKGAFLADEIIIDTVAAGKLSDDFGDYSAIKEREVHHHYMGEFRRSFIVQTPKYIQGLFNSKFCFIQKYEKPQSIRLNLLTDDRMFFQSWYGNNAFSKSLEIINNTTKKEKEGEVEEEEIEYSQIRFEDTAYKKMVRKRSYPDYNYQYVKNSNWYAYMFGDKNSPSIANNEMQQEHTEYHTYARWAGYGTLFGFTRDSFVAVSQNIPTLIQNAPNLRDQMKTMYYQMAVLSLAQRASVLRFSAEVACLADLALNDRDTQLMRDVKVIYKNYIEFINKIYYREITPYIQGIEMYEKFQQVMGMAQRAKDLDQELEELFNYLQLEESEKLNKIAAAFLPVSLLVGVLGMSALSVEALEKVVYAPDFIDIDWPLTLLILSTCAAMAYSLWIISKQIISGKNILKWKRKL